MSYVHQGDLEISLMYTYIVDDRLVKANLKLKCFYLSVRISRYKFHKELGIV